MISILVNITASLQKRVKATAKTVAFCFIHGHERDARASGGGLFTNTSETPDMNANTSLQFVAYVFNYFFQTRILAFHQDHLPI
ncbi:hypothetical protein J2786_003963 [Chryseobacterium vietnamense]|uniref:Uncharacterized protein n=1 Tax=Chryseobacterium vietnamense TaxID=866785 RepID=A0ACC6JDC3_9FLAO|nr:hypothetical protein [Chryseobacterium vietnamense]